MSHDVIIGGAAVPLGLPGKAPPIVLTWHDHGIEFRAGEGFTKARRHRIDLAVWHWTGGEQEPPQMVETLKARGYGVEFAIARTGVVWQFADPMHVDTADAAGVNARSVGTEIVSYGRRGDGPPPHVGENRLSREVLIHGKRVRVADFYPAQISAALALADGLSRAIPSITRRVPLSTDGLVYTRQLSAIEVGRFTGHVGHYHLSVAKTDPGPAFMNELRRLFAADAPDPIV